MVDIASFAYDIARPKLDLFFRLSRFLTVGCKRVHAQCEDVPLTAEYLEYLLGSSPREDDALAARLTEKNLDTFSGLPSGSMAVVIAGVLELPTEREYRLMTISSLTKIM